MVVCGESVGMCVHLCVNVARAGSSYALHLITVAKWVHSNWTVGYMG